MSIIEIGVGEGCWCCCLVLVNQLSALFGNGGGADVVDFMPTYSCAITGHNVGCCAARDAHSASLAAWRMVGKAAKDKYSHSELRANLA